MTKRHKSYGYDKNVDYKEKMDAAAAAGDYEAAARYEQQRNEKIAGEGLTQYQPTQQYREYLPKTNAEQMEELFDQIMNRDKFSYDLNGDALYQQYKDQYVEQGRLAMQDTMGQAAALTGGYGNSYAMTAGQQAYGQQLDRLNDLVPDLYALARSNYEQEGNELWQQYEATAAREQEEYDREQQEYEAAVAREQLEYDREQQEYDREREEQDNAREEARERQDDAFSLAMTMLQNGLMPSEGVLSTAGISQADANAIYNKANTPVSHSSSGGGGGGGTTWKTLSTKEYEKLAQRYKEGGDDAIAGLIAAYGYQGYDAEALWDWVHRYYVYEEESPTPQDPPRKDWQVIAMPY